MEPQRIMTARQGRANQRFNEEGLRLVAGVVALSKDLSKVLLITSSKHKDRYVLPKGGYELDEDSFQDACKREAWEEGGIIIQKQDEMKSLGFIPDKRPESKLSKSAPRALYHFFQVIDPQLADDWPEKYCRDRMWVDYSTAVGLLERRPELLQALQSSCIIK